MSSSSRTRRRLTTNVIVVLLAALPATARVCAQAPGTEMRSEHQVALAALGASLFGDPRLSSTGSMSCATCHRPDRAFTEDRKRAVGQNGIDLGRNTPTLFGLSSVERFPVGGSRSGPRAVSLEERCVVPLRDAEEMCGRVGEAIDRLAGDPSCVATFNVVFEEPGSGREPAGITGDRIAKALAEYVRSLRHWEGPTHAALAGAEVVLEEPVKRGLDVFRGEGRCQSCHSGTALTDGNLYVVSRRLGVRDDVGLQPVSGASRAPDSRPRPETRANRPVRKAGGYGQRPTLERQTLTLLDVRRTGPYFRDGSVALLSDAVRQHVTELRDIGATREAFFGKPAKTPPPAGQPSPKHREAGMLSLSATRQLSSDGWIPGALSQQQLDDVVAFLSSLSPGD